MSGKKIALPAGLFLIVVFCLSSLTPASGVGKTITVILTVDGTVQTDDPWTTGARRVNEWAKPMYRIWFDANGNPNDGGWDNGWGPRQAELWLDTGRVGFIWHGPDGKPNTKDDVKHWPLNKIDQNSWSDQGIEASIYPDGKSFKVSLPLEKLGNPRTLEVSFMASPWTTTASDNLGPGANSRPAWIVVSDATKEGTYSQVDRKGDNDWPNLTPGRKSNFDVVKAEVVIGYMDSDGDGLSDEVERKLRVTDPKKLDLEVWTVEFADPKIPSKFKGRRYIFYTAPKTLDPAERGPTGSSYEKVLHGAVAKSLDGSWTEKFRVYIPVQADAQIEDLAEKIIRLLLHLYWYGKEYLDYKPRYGEPFHGQSMTPVWLTPNKSRSGAAAAQRNENLIFYDVNNALNRSSEEWVRVVSHEYAHMTVKGAMGYIRTAGGGDAGATEANANGYLGERLFARWFKRNLENSTSSLANEWDSKEEVWDSNGIDNWNLFYTNSNIVALFNNQTPTDSRVIQYWQDNQCHVTDNQRLPGFYAFIGMVLDVENSLGPTTLKKVMEEIPSWTPKSFYDVCKKYLPPEKVEVTASISIEGGIFKGIVGYPDKEKTTIKVEVSNPSLDMVCKNLTLRMDLSVDDPHHEFFYKTKGGDVRKYKESGWRRKALNQALKRGATAEVQKTIITHPLKVTHGSVYVWIYDSAGKELAYKQIWLDHVPGGYPDKTTVYLSVKR
ncbi:MAG: thrombospondin type 3 repeat-containing protein [bacterium]